MKYTKIVMMGPPGCGKGTQSKLISKKYNISHVSSGDIVREEIKKGSPVGQTIQEITDAGDLTPDEIINALVFNKLNMMDSYVLDGYPRKVDQAEMLGDKVDVVIFIDVDEDTCIKRICERNEGRKDDNEETAKKRYEIYKKLTAPILDFYTNQGKLKTINGSVAPETVFENISEIIDNSKKD